MARMSVSFIIGLIVRIAIGGTGAIKYLKCSNSECKTEMEHIYIISVIPSLLADCLPFLIVFLLHYKNYQEQEYESQASEIYEGSDYNPTTQDLSFLSLNRSIH